MGRTAFRRNQIYAASGLLDRILSRHKQIASGYSRLGPPVFADSPWAWRLNRSDALSQQLSRKVAFRGEDDTIGSVSLF